MVFLFCVKNTKLFNFYIFENFIKNISLKNNRQTPKAKKKSKIITAHSDARNDHYYWLNDATNPEVIDYLKKENRYCDQMMSHTKAFQTTLFDEMKSRIKEDDESVPYKFNSYWYIVKYDVGKDYPIYIRRKESLNAVDEVLFDCNDMAKGHMIADVVTIIGTQDIVFGEIDR